MTNEFFSRSGGRRRRAAAVENAWKLHQAQMEWTSRVDAKAAFALTLESAAITVAVGFGLSGRVFAEDTSGVQLLLFLTGSTLLLAGAALSAYVVTPLLSPGRGRKLDDGDFVYFGHARRRSADELAKALEADELLPQLTRQIVRMAEIAWIKHVRVKWSLMLGGAGAILVVLFAFTKAM